MVPIEIPYGNGFKGCLFQSLYELREWSEETPIGRFGESLYRLQSHNDSGSQIKFAGCSWGESVAMLTEGWTVEAEAISQKLKASEWYNSPNVRKRLSLDVVGFSPVVPLALRGIPTNMVGQRKMPVRDRVITINKSIGYNASVKAREIREESVKALAIVQALEKSGYSVNLNVIWSLSPERERGYGHVFKVRIKGANERLNVSKMAFPLVHSGFLRRTMFDVLEKWPDAYVSYTNGYGYPVSDTQLESMIDKEVLLPCFIDQKLTQIRDADALANALNVQVR